MIKNWKQFLTEQKEDLDWDKIDWDKIENYWDNLSSSERFIILSKDYFADPDVYKNWKFKNMPSDVQNNLLKYFSELF